MTLAFRAIALMGVAANPRSTKICSAALIIALRVDSGSLCRVALTIYFHAINWLVDQNIPNHQMGVKLKESIDLMRIGSKEIKANTLEVEIC